MGAPALGPTRALARGLAGASALKPEGEASPGPADGPGSSGYSRLEEGSAHPRAWEGSSQTPERKLAGEASPAPCRLPGMGPSEYGRLEEGSARPRSRHVPVAWSELSEHSHAWESSSAPDHLVGLRAKPRTRAPNLGPAGAPEPKMTGEALIGPVDSQAWAPQGTAGWRKVVSAPRLVGARPRPLNQNQRGKPLCARWTPSLGPLRVQQAGGREHQSQGTAGAQPGP
ncbi:hypothetical protein NDU88_006603 [Pleurodeles waltl]|uniref:Uncharacterized protein n=1 Tax=Pleurodeles waltl TaxID=8319 RepID=A0AAV7X246_PLEWA|nr:hypothetical protein NDU88_006603 [Pleurodeles waltl]